MGIEAQLGEHQALCGEDAVKGILVAEFTGQITEALRLRSLAYLISHRKCFPMNPNKALWEKGDFTRIAATMRESGEAT